MAHFNSQSKKRNSRFDGSRKYPELVVAPTPAEREATYYAALELVAHIDEALTRGTRHYRNRAGELLTTLDEVVGAILSNNLLLPEAEAEMMWMAPQELAA
jgi:hypothetical protein